ncbi:MAG: 4-(cytidine 5'-diphospho)-2-C-methyl-D-erythritol kinase [Elusimicrobiota bacterium]
MKKIVIRANAKINLYFNILSKLKNGYHVVETLMQNIGLYDTVELSVLKKQGKVITLVCKGVEIGVGKEKNIAYRAAMAVLAENKCGTGIKVVLTKRIPTGAGLGGGSSDAAAVITGLNRLLGLRMSVKKMRRLAATLGADVPFFIPGGCAKAEGIGEKLEILDIKLKKHLLLIHPGINSNTKDAYGAYDSFIAEQKQRGKLTKKYGKGRINDIVAHVKNKGISADVLYNCLEPTVFNRYPEVCTVKETLVSAGLDTVLMTGSGSAVYAFLPNRAAGVKLKKYVNGKFPRWRVWVTSTTPGGAVVLNK